MWYEIKRWMRNHHGLMTVVWVVLGYMLHLTVEGTIFAYLGAKAQAAGWVTV